MLGLIKKVLKGIAFVCIFSIIFSCKKEVIQNNIAETNAQKVGSSIGQSQTFSSTSGKILYISNSIGQVIFAADAYYKVDNLGFIEVGSTKGEKKSYSLANLLLIDISYIDFPRIYLNL